MEEEVKQGIFNQIKEFEKKVIVGPLTKDMLYKMFMDVAQYKVKDK